MAILKAYPEVIVQPWKAIQITPGDAGANKKLSLDRAVAVKGDYDYRVGSARLAYRHRRLWGGEADCFEPKRRKAVPRTGGPS